MSYTNVTTARNSQFFVSFASIKTFENILSYVPLKPFYLPEHITSRSRSVLEIKSAVTFSSRLHALLEWFIRLYVPHKIELLWKFLGFLYPTQVAQQHIILNVCLLVRPSKPSKSSCRTCTRNHSYAKRQSLVVPKCSRTKITKNFQLKITCTAQNGSSESLGDTKWHSRDRCLASYDLHKWHSST